MFFFAGRKEMVEDSKGLGGIVFVFFDGMASPQDATRPSKVALMRLFLRETYMRNGGL